MAENDEIMVEGNSINILNNEKKVITNDNKIRNTKHDTSILLILHG